MAAKIYRINYKSDFILTLNSDAGWMTPFCIKFWTGAPSQAFFVGWDGETYTHCAYNPSEPTKLQVQFDDHHLPIGDLKFQIGYHFTVADFPNDTEDEVINPASITTEIDGETYQVMLDFTGETAPEIEFSLPAYANEAQRIANEQQRIANEQTRIENEQTRISNEQTRVAHEQTRQQNEAQRIAQESARVSEFASLKSASEAATRDANNAATLANEKAQLAADKAALADSAATQASLSAVYAHDEGQLAGQKAIEAAQATQLATNEAAFAHNQGNYAKNQGDYAKEQGDTALADHVRANEDHSTAVDDHTQANNDHTRSESDHSTAAADHTTAGNDHTRAESDHGIAVDDHTQAGNDHTRAESDHGIASDDHTQAGNDHTRAESDHTRAESDHAAVEVYVDSLGAFDISAYHATGGVLAEYADLTAALGTNGANIPDALRKGGMSVKFVTSSDNKYVQYRFMLSEFTAAQFTNTANWQGVDEEPTAGSDNLVKSGGAWDINNFLGSLPPNIEMQNGFYKQDLSFSSNLNWKCAIVDITGYKVLYIRASVRETAYLSITDASNNVLWQSNDSTKKTRFIDLSTITDASKLYLSNETSVVSNPCVSNLTNGMIEYMLDKILNNEASINKDEQTIKNNADNIEVEKDVFGFESIFSNIVLTKGFYKSDLSENTTANGWKHGVVDISGLENIIIKAAVRGDAYLSVTDANDNILWQSNDSQTQRTIKLSNYPTATKLYFSNEYSIVETPYVASVNNDSVVFFLDDVNNIISTSPISILFTLTNGFYNSDLSSNSNQSWTRSLVDISTIKRIPIYINAHVRESAYLSITDVNDNILWQTNNGNSDTHIVDLSNIPTAAKLYLCSEKSVVPSPTVVYYGDLYNINKTVKEQGKEIEFIKHNLIVHKIAHFSFDDVHYCLEDLTTNKDVYTTIFDNPFFATLKSCHDTYGMCFSLYVFETATASDGVSEWLLSGVTNKFASEFALNSNWLKFAPHSGNPTTGIQSGDYSDIITELLRITGSVDCIDTVPRFDSFLGSLSVCLECRDAQCGIDGLLAADDDRVSYYLDNNQNGLVYNKGKYYDYVNQLYFFKTLRRIETVDPATTLATLLTKDGFNYSNNAILFTHEYRLYGSNLVINSTILNRINYCGNWCNEHNYVWTFPMYKVRAIL